MSVVTTLQVPGPWRFSDLEGLPDDGHRYELVDGILLVSPSPRPLHQEVVGELYECLRRSRPRGVAVMVAPLDVVLSDDTVVEPDLLVAPMSAFGEKNLPLPPLLAVEVLSPGTGEIDLTLKFQRYEKAGIASYWIIDPDELRLIAYDLVDARYVCVADVTGDGSWTAERPFPVTITPSQLLDWHARG